MAFSIRYQQQSQPTENSDSSDDLPNLQICYDAQCAYDLQQQLNSGKSTINVNVPGHPGENPQFFNTFTEQISTGSNHFARERTDADIANQLQFLMYENIEDAQRPMFHQVRPHDRQANPFRMSYPGTRQSVRLTSPQIQVNTGLNGWPAQNTVSSMGNPLFGLIMANQLNSRPRNVFNSPGRHSIELQDDLSYEQMIEIEDLIGSVPAQGLKKIDTQRIPKFRYCLDRTSNSNDGKCAICLELFTTGKMVRKLKCDHIFDVACIDNWLKEKAECPICRKEIQ